MSAYIMLYELKTMKVNTYIKHIFGKVDLLPLHATLKLFQMYCFNGLQEAKTHLYTGHWKYSRNLTMLDFVSDRTLETIV